MKNSKILLSAFMVLIIIFASIFPSLAITAPEDSFLDAVQWQNKINEVLLNKMSTVSDEELIPVWVWLTDIDMNELEEEIEAKTGLSQQKLDIAKSEINYDVLINSLDNNLEKTLQFSTQKETVLYIETTKEQRKELANDTEIYLSAKKSLAQKQYITSNTTKIRKLGVSNSKIDFKSELTPSFIAYLTKDEIIETAMSNDVVEMGYFDEYDEDIVKEPVQDRVLEKIEPTEEPTIDVSTLHTEVKQAIQHDLALDKYRVTGKGVTVLYLDSSYVLDHLGSSNEVLHPENIINYVDGTEFSFTEDLDIPHAWNMGGHANYCVSYLQAFAEDVQVYSVVRNEQFTVHSEATLDETGNNQDERINSYDDIEALVSTKNIDIINASCSEDMIPYELSYSSRWFDAIVATYNITLVASAGNTDNPTNYQNVLSPAGGYNSIAVGVYNTYLNRMCDNYKYNAGDDKVSYKPDLVVAMDNYAGSFGATSAGAPVVTAIVAMMMEQDPSLKGQPEIIKSILMASCHEKAQRSKTDETAGTEQEEMSKGLTLKQGAGKVNALRALNIVAFGTYGCGYIIPNQNWVNVSKFYLNSQVYGDSGETYPVNVSTAWLRKNTKSSNTPSENQVALGHNYDIILSVFHPDQIEEERKKSEVENSGKQLAFIGNPELDKEYRIRLSWPSADSSDRGMVKYGYAYSVGNFEKVLEKIELAGTTAIEKKLTASAYTADTLLAETSALTYRWFSSSDGETWQLISGAVSPTYTLTDSDFNKYIKCRVTQDYLKDCMIEVEVKTDIPVVRFGDVDMDGAVTPMDATKIRLYVAGLADLTQEKLLAADVDGDGYATIIDATSIQQYCAGLIDHFLVEE